jgi:hypothetical protein
LAAARIPAAASASLRTKREKAGEGCISSQDWMLKRRAGGREGWEGGREGGGEGGREDEINRKGKDAFLPRTEC